MPLDYEVASIYTGSPAEAKGRGIERHPESTPGRRPDGLLKTRIQAPRPCQHLLLNMIFQAATTTKTVPRCRISRHMATRIHHMPRHYGYLLLGSVFAHISYLAYPFESMSRPLGSYRKDIIFFVISIFTDSRPGRDRRSCSHYLLQDKNLGIYDPDLLLTGFWFEILLLSRLVLVRQL
jgi:hypothetical protein